MNGWTIIYLSCLAGLGTYAVHRLSLIALLWRGRLSGLPAAVSSQPASTSSTAPSTERPRVTVQLPIFNERFVAERLITAAAALQWPREKLQIQVLDDSTDDTASLAASVCDRFAALGVDIEYLHREVRSGFKAGALAAGLDSATGELILILDADFIPPPDLLENMADGFADPDVGMVQARWEHLNRDHSMLTEVQALLLDGHFGVEQTARSRNGRLFNFNGTAGMWRRAAIDDAGGWKSDTLTEDLDLSYRALLAGWKFQYLPDVVAPAELPEPMSGFKSQQFRWAKGSIQVACKLLPRVLTDRRLTRLQRIEGFFHLTQNVPYLLTAILALVCVPALVIAPRPSGLAFISLDALLLVGTVGTLALYCAAAEESIGKSWGRALLRLPALIAVTVGISVSQTRAVLEGAFGTESPFIRTPKSGVVSQVSSSLSLSSSVAGAEVRPAPSRASYRSRVGLIPFAELLLAGYFVFGVALAIATDRHLAVPALTLFACGFGYVGVRSVTR